MWTIDHALPVLLCPLSSSKAIYQPTVPKANNAEYPVMSPDFRPQGPPFVGIGAGILKNALKLILLNQ